LSTSYSSLYNVSNHHAGHTTMLDSFAKTQHQKILLMRITLLK
jgi:hypothetical protein